MSAPREGPCVAWTTWADVEACCDGLPVVPPGPLVTPEVLAWRAYVIEVATWELWDRTGRKYGQCPRTVRLCRSCYCERHPCECSHVLDTVRLPRTPVVSVEEVIVDGAVLDPALYRVDEWALLVRTDGIAWPSCSDLPTNPLTPGVFEVTWVYGREVPPGLADAAATFACELAKRCLSLPCRLPETVQLVQVEGATFGQIDRQTLALAGNLGIASVDRAVAAWGGPGGRAGAVTGFTDPAYRPRHRVVDTDPVGT